MASPLVEGEKSSMELIVSPLLIVLVLLVVLAAMGFNVLREYERAVIFRLGRVAQGLVGGNGPGVVVIIPFVDKLVRVSLRTVALDVPPQDVITRDNVSVKVNAVVYFRVIDQQRAIIQIQDYLYATSVMAQTTLRSVLGQSQLDDLLAKREEINSKLQLILDQQTEPWGVKVSAVEVKNVDLPQEMQRVIAKQAEAERERRSKVIHAEGEFQAAQRLADAATVMSQNPMALQLRYLQTLVEVAAEKNSTTIFPIPIDMLTPFIQGWQRPNAGGERNDQMK
jgi:regulator of protease activity HflC (stomatin/prohibitin superfamily)